LFREKVFSGRKRGKGRVVSEGGSAARMKLSRFQVLVQHIRKLGHREWFTIACRKAVARGILYFEQK
jgi:hypothetical protein